jgi:DNA invertase Pin-like site-specific DNA recombinase
MKITKIQAPPKPPDRLRVAAYSRVSDGKDAMLRSLSAQVSYYSALIQKNPAWIYAGTFADEDFTGTKAQRPEFQRLLAACRAGEIDAVITKSVSRFARNTVDTLETVRELRHLGVDVYFEEQGVHTLSADGEFLLTLLASYAQEESYSCSENCKWRIRKDFQEGKPTPCKVYGYARDFTIIPVEAAVVKGIFADYLSGMGTLAIQKKLLAQGVKFSINALRQMLRNEKYVGNLLLQKTFTQDHLTKKRLKNDGQLPTYLVENHHEAIIGKATFEAVQSEIARRAARYHAAPPPQDSYAFSGLIRCGICGAAYRHKIAGAAPKYKKSVWICATFNSLGKTHCASQMIPEDILEAKTLEAGGFEGLQEILVPGLNQLQFIYADGHVVDTTWAHPSRSQSWTPEMREAARQKSIERRAAQ